MDNILTLTNYDPTLASLKRYLAISIEEHIKIFEVKGFSRYDINLEIYLETNLDELNEIYDKLQKDLLHLPLEFEIQEGNKIHITLFGGYDTSVYSHMGNFTIL